MTDEHKTYEVPAPDGTTVELARTWTTEQITGLMREALEIVDELNPDEDLRLQSFQTALALVGQVVPRNSQIAVVPGGILRDTAKVH